MLFPYRSKGAKKANEAGQTLAIGNPACFF